MYKMQNLHYLEKLSNLQKNNVVLESPNFCRLFP